MVSSYDMTFVYAEEKSNREKCLEDKDENACMEVAKDAKNSLADIEERIRQAQSDRTKALELAKYEEEKEQIGERLAKLEQAAVLIGKGLPCSFMVMKLSAGMDELQPDQRMRCSSFASAMNAVEGVMVSAETEKEIQRWHTGEKSFQAVFESTLQRYGFPIGDEA